MTEEIKHINKKNQKYIAENNRMTEKEKEKIINAFNNAWSRKIASENSYGKLASKEMFENKKEIIIDGVNVAGCIFFDKDNGYNICCCDDTRDEKIPFANFCLENKGCYYKLHKKSELQLNVDKTQINSFIEETETLKSENKNLKNELQQLYHSFGKTYPLDLAPTFMGKSLEYWLRLEHEYESLFKSFLNFQEVLNERLDSLNRKIQEVLNE